MSAFDALVSDYAMSCPACPTQYEGTLHDGRRFYFRYRWGFAELGLGASVEEAVEDSVGKGVRRGDRLHGEVDEDEFKALFVELMEGAG